MIKDDSSLPPTGSMRREHRQRREVIALCRVDVARAVDLACEHFAKYSPDPVVLRELCRAANAADTSPAVRLRLDALLRRQIPALREASAPCDAVSGHGCRAMDEHRAP